MAITSASTLEDVVEQLLDNSEYETSSGFDATKLRAWIGAARAFLVLCPSQTHHTASGFAMNKSEIAEQLKSAEARLGSASAVNGGVIHSSVRNYRR